MRFRDSLAINISPIFLRLVLGVTFFWAGYGKVFVSSPYTPEQIATLQTGVFQIETTTPDDDAAGQTPQGAGTPEEPIPDPNDSDADDDIDTSARAPEGFLGEESFRVITVQDDAEQLDAETIDEDDAAGDGSVKKRNLYRVALLIHETKLLPGFLSEGQWPVRLAWLAALTELLGGAFALLGFLTRLSAAGLAGTMAVALWMTSIGPVVVYGAPSFLGFLPAVDMNDPTAWMTWLWQFALLGASLSLLFGGPGALSLDRALIGRREAKNAKPTAKPKIDLDDE